MSVENNAEKFRETRIKGLVIVDFPYNLDERGFLQEFYRENEFEFAGHKFTSPHGALSFSKPGVIRGIHTEEWTKLAIPVTGEMLGAYVDTREDSETFGQVHTEVFNYSDPDVRHQAVLIPPGVGNSICVTGNQGVMYVYLNSEYWEPDRAKGVSLFDPDLNIKWPVKNPIVSDRDRNNPTLRELFPHKFGDK